MAGRTAVSLVRVSYADEVSHVRDATEAVRQIVEHRDQFTRPSATRRLCNQRISFTLCSFLKYRSQCAFFHLCNVL